MIHNKNYIIYVLQFILSGFLSAFVVFNIINTIKHSNYVNKTDHSNNKKSKKVSTITKTYNSSKNAQKTPNLQKGRWIGKVSHYSRSGCLGCSQNLLMANGKPLDDEGLTIAFNYLPLGSSVKLTNLDNGKSIVAEVTDTGGFTGLGRIADLTPKVASALLSKTDVSNIMIEELKINF